MIERAQANASPAGPRPLEQEGWTRTSPAGILAHGLRGLRQAILPIVAVIFGTGMRESGMAYAGLLGGAIVLINFLVAALGWWKMQYRIGEADIRVQRGIIGRQARSVPFERIQDVSLEQSLLARLLGLVEVRFETGAGGTDELALAYVSQSEGEALRETVRARMEAGREAEATPDRPAEQAAQGRLLFAMGPQRLFVFGLFEFSLVVFVVLAGLAQQLDFLLPFDPWDFDGWEERLAGSDTVIASALAGLGWASRLMGLVLALLALALVGLATGLFRTFSREHGFRLERTAKGFRRRRGLFTRTDVVMPVHRVQALKITTGALRRLWGWHGLSFISLAQDAGSASHAVAPFARLGEMAPIAREAGFALPGAETQWRRPSLHYRLDRAIAAAAVPLLGGGAVLLFGQDLLGAGRGALVAVAGIIALLLAGWQLLLRRNERYALDDVHLLARTGWLSPRITIASRAKLHSVEIGRGPIARIRGYACLRFGLAGGRLAMNGVPLAEARAIRRAVLASISEVDFSRLPR